MAIRLQSPLVSSTVGLLLMSVAGCAVAGELSLETDTSSVVVEELPPAPEAPVALVFSPPASCVNLLPEGFVKELAADGIELVKGPGSPSTEPIYTDGQTPEELAGGLSCLFGLPNDEESGLSILLSAAPIDPAIRPKVIEDLVTQNLNVGQTIDGRGLTYWIWGDNETVSALHNELFQDAWYSALIQPGGRPAYDQGVALVAAMRSSTTQ